jgi:putative hemolysin
MNAITTEILILFLLILVNGLFSMSEMAVVASKKVRLQQRADGNNKGAQVALALAGKPTQFLSTIQIGITLIGILSGAFGGATIAEELAAVFSKQSGLAPYSETLSVTIVVLTVTYLTLVIGELVPKRLALNNAERIAAAVAPLMQTVSKIAKPAVNLLGLSTELVLVILRAKPSGEPSVTEEEIKIMIDEGTQVGVFEEVEQEIMERVFRLGDRKISSLMAHSTEMVWLDVGDPLEENLRKMVASGHSNFLICRGELDKVIGIARIKDLFARCAEGQPVDIKPTSPLPPFVLESMTALEVLKKFKESNSQIALVIDEYGSIAGMVTLTDVLEAIVGDIPAVDVEGEPEAVQREDGSWLFDGMLAIDDLRIFLDLDELPNEDEGNYETLGGLLMTQLGRIPFTGDHIEWENLRFEVVDMDGHRVDKVMVTPVTKASPPPEE